MRDAIFLSAGVPDPKRSPKYAESADAVAIVSAVAALIYVTLGRRLLVWGGQPAITPMVWAVADALGTNYGGWVTLYQSTHFEDEFPEDNKRFENVVYVNGVGRDREKSLQAMREKMFSDFIYSAAVFIGGMEGIVAEFKMLKAIQPMCRVLPIASTGGAAEAVANFISDASADLWKELDYVALFHRQLGVSVKELRYRSPAEQPEKIGDRLWGNV